MIINLQLNCFSWGSGSIQFCCLFSRPAVKDAVNGAGCPIVGFMIVLVVSNPIQLLMIDMIQMTQPEWALSGVPIMYLIHSWPWVKGLSRAQFLFNVSYCQHSWELILTLHIYAYSLNMTWMTTVNCYSQGGLIPIPNIYSISLILRFQIACKILILGRNIGYFNPCWYYLRDCSLECLKG